MIEDAIQQFRLNIKSAEELGYIVDAIQVLAPYMDTSEVLRAQMVLAVSAFDCFIHDLVRLGTVEIYQGIRRYDQKKTLKPEFEISKLHHLLTLSKQDQLKELNKEFQRIFKTKTFQEPNIIEKNLICIGLENIWFEVGLKMALSKEDLIRDVSFNRLHFFKKVSPLKFRKIENFPKLFKKTRLFRISFGKFPIFRNLSGEIFSQSVTYFCVKMKHPFNPPN